MSQIIGHISQVIGPVVDVYFEGKGIDTDLLLPSIHDALTIKRNDGRILVVEVQQHIGEDTVRTVAMDSTDGLQRGMEVIPTGHPITMPVGNQIKGRLMNVVGEAVDGMRPLSKEGAFPIHREPLSLMNCLLCRKCSSQVSRLLICWNLIQRVVKSDCLGGRCRQDRAYYGAD